jgi:predicted transposase YbfD/YdcC
MEIIKNLSEELQKLEVQTDYQGHYYRISHILTILICGFLCGLQRIDDINEWSKARPTRAFLEEYFGIVNVPSRAQFYNILGHIDADKFNLCFIRWMNGILKTADKGKTISIDGKTICGTKKLSESGIGLSIVSAVISEHNLVIGSCECGNKQSEVAAFRELIYILDVSGAVIVADALHCKKKSAQKVIEADDDYLFIVKDNEPTLKSDIELFIQSEKLQSYSTSEQNGGRIERRTAYTSFDIEWLDGHKDWENIACIGAIHRQFEKNGEKTSEWHYYISSKTLTPEELLHHARMEWRVESMHWLLDVHLDEDKTIIWDINVQKLLNFARKSSLNLARLYKTHNCDVRTALSDILKRNLFDTENLAMFLDFFRLNSLVY